jgi:hypothetical protein
MNRLGAAFWLMLAIGTGAAMFTVKYTVQNLDDELARVRKQTVAEQLELRVLNAEWTYLTQPERLAELNRQFLSLAPIAIKQLRHSIAEIPLRPAPQPEEPAVAAAAPSVPDMLPSSSGDLPVTPVSLRDSEPPAPALVRAATERVLPRAAPAPSSRANHALDALFAQIAGDR